MVVMFDLEVGSRLKAEKKGKKEQEDAMIGARVAKTINRVNPGKQTFSCNSALPCSLSLSSA
jgi:hypothetical protein